MFSVGVMFSWGTDVQRPTVDPSSKTTRDDTALTILAKREPGMPH